MMTSPANLNFNIIDFQAQLWNFMNFHLQLQKTSSSSSSSSESSESTTSSEVVGILKTSTPSISSNAFSIENILNDFVVKNGNLEEKSVEEEEDEDLEDAVGGTPSPTCSTNGFTLETLQNLDRRSLNKKSSTHRCVCDKCGKSYATTSNLSRHKQTHRALDSPHAKQCPHCDRVYVSMPALSMHILTHNASHECDLCGKRFSRLWLLQGHLRSHSGIRPFSCQQCGKSFADRSNLRAHMLTHSGDKNFECSKCNRRFALRAYLNRHLETCK